MLALWVTAWMCGNQPALASCPWFMSWRATVTSKLTFLRQTRGGRFQQVFLSLRLVSRQNFSVVLLSCSPRQCAQHAGTEGQPGDCLAEVRTGRSCGSGRAQAPLRPRGTGGVVQSWLRAGGPAPTASRRTSGAAQRLLPAAQARSRRWLCCLKSRKLHSDANDSR